MGCGLVVPYLDMFGRIALGPKYTTVGFAVGIAGRLVGYVAFFPLSWQFVRRPAASMSMVWPG
jgi:hypothetical protein